MNLKKLKRTVVSLFLIGAILFAAPLGAMATSSFPFTDVPQNHWARSYIASVHEAGIMTGVTATSFEPGTNLNRVMAVATIFRMYHGRIANANDSRQNPFTDVTVDNWFAPYVTWAYNNDIVSGVGNNRFAPLDNLTREQFAVILFRFAESEGLDVRVPATFNLNSFTDHGQVSNWATTAMRFVNYNGILQGATATSLNPGGHTNRAQGATLLYRFLNYVEEQTEAEAATADAYAEAAIVPDVA